MIISKPTLKKMLNYATERIDITKSERQLQKELKCAVFEYELYKTDELFYDIFTKVLNLCVIKHS